MNNKEGRARAVCLAQKGDHQASRAFEQAHKAIDAIPDFPEAFSTLELRQAVDGFVAVLAEWAPFFERKEPGLSLAVLREATGAAGWFWPSWGKVHDALPTSETGGRSPKEAQ